MLQVEFSMPYRTAMGETIHCHFETSSHTSGSIALQSVDGVLWTGRLNLPESTQYIRYSYSVQGSNGMTMRREAGIIRTVELKGLQLVLCADNWFDTPMEHAFTHPSFIATVMPATDAPQVEGQLHFRLYAPPPPVGYTWAIIGESADLGAWQPQRALALHSHGSCCWGLQVARQTAIGAYKYILRSDNDPLQIIWEEGENRHFEMPVYANIGHIFRADHMPKVGEQHWRTAGVVIPLFSLRSEESQGIGDFGDLEAMIDWAAIAGMHTIQLLPINDTMATNTMADSYPYNALSVFALHPLYLDLRPWKKSAAYAQYSAVFHVLNQAPVLDYAGVSRAKMACLRELFIEQGVRTLASAAYQRFAKENADWLPAYALFCTLKEKYHTANFRTWKQLSAYDAYAVAHYLKSHTTERAEMDFYCFVQYLLFEQVERVHSYARKKGILLKGDLPIGVSRDSVDAWVSPQLFHFNGQAGAPPDAFAVAGQNWGFPTYNWEEMARNNYAWWRRRLEVMSHAFDAYRIDHVLGFFRIWEIPFEQTQGLLGRFRPAQPYSPEELVHFGFTASPQDYSVACISAARLAEIAEQTTYDIRRYFSQHNGMFYLNSDVDTQRKIVERVAEEEVRHLLMSVCTEVLFIADPQQSSCYHPRISAQQTYRYHQLKPEDQAAFNRLHDHFFYVRHNHLWAEEAFRKLSAITTPTLAKPQKTGMLPCAEDLGMVPASVKGVLEQLHILSLEIQRMPKTYGVRFDDTAGNPYYSVATIATHDMPPFRLWWARHIEERQAFWQEVMHYEGTAPEEATADLCTAVVAKHLASPSMLCLLAWQDWMATSPALRATDPATEQINEPANPHHYWSYRMHLTLEALHAATDFNAHLRYLIARSGR